MTWYGMVFQPVDTYLNEIIFLQLLLGDLSSKNELMIVCLQSFGTAVAFANKVANCVRCCWLFLLTRAGMTDVLCFVETQ